MQLSLQTINSKLETLSAQRIMGAQVSIFVVEYFRNLWKDCSGEKILPCLQEMTLVHNVYKMSGRSASVYTDTSALHEYLRTLIRNGHEFCKQGGGAHIHIFVLCIINFFWNRLILQSVNTNIIMNMCPSNYRLPRPLVNYLISNSLKQSSF